MFNQAPTHTWTALTRRLATALSAAMLPVLVLTSCSDRLPDGFGDVCTDDSDCLSGLDCVYRYTDRVPPGTCLSPCTDDKDCPVVCRALFDPKGASYCRDDGYCDLEACE